ncbi:hypothetical protein Dimus_017042 [Dionaea muscipula]
MSESETMDNPNDWFPFYQTDHQLPHHRTSTSTAAFPIITAPLSDATVISTTTMIRSSSTSTTSSTGTTGAPHHQVSPDGRVSKPTRRRARASRRTPTTLLNTDPSNFRAMVQQFTGGPSSTFNNIISAPPPAAAGTRGFQNQMVNPAAAPAGNRIDFEQLQQFSGSGQQQPISTRDHHHQQVFIMGVAPADHDGQLGVYQQHGPAGVSSSSSSDNKLGNNGMIF